MVTTADILQKIHEVSKDFDLDLNNKISKIFLEDKKIFFAIQIDNIAKEKCDSLHNELTNQIKQMQPTKEVSIILTSQKQQAEYAKFKPQKKVKPKTKLKNIKNTILFSSCKGGVGKSTCAINVAASLANNGYKVGLVDADIYGPSIPRMMNIYDEPIIEDNHMIPHFKHGIYSVSIGYIFDKEKATIWRGPMVTKALYQLLQMTKWPELDYLIIDMPPGTGDVHLTIGESYQVNGAVLISTPQTLATDEIIKSLDMYQKLEIPVIGLIENMSYFKDDNGNKNYIFGKDGVKNIAKKYELNLLGEIPLDQNLSQSSDRGEIAAISIDNFKLNFGRIADAL